MSYADRIIFPDPSSSVMLVKSLMAEGVRLESDDEEADTSEAEAPKAGTSEDRLMKLATVLAEEVSQGISLPSRPSRFLDSSEAKWVLASILHSVLRFHRGDPAWFLELFVAFRTWSVFLCKKLSGVSGYSLSRILN